MRLEVHQLPAGHLHHVHNHFELIFDMDSESETFAALERLSARDTDSDTEMSADLEMLSVIDRVSSNVIVCVSFVPVAVSVNDRVSESSFVVDLVMVSVNEIDSDTSSGSRSSSASSSPPSSSSSFVVYVRDRVSNN